MKVIIKRKKIYYPTRKEKQLKKAKRLLAAGLRHCNFVWNEKEYLEIVAMAEKENLKPNDFIWNHLSKTLLNK